MIVLYLNNDLASYDLDHDVIIIRNIVGQFWLICKIMGCCYGLDVYIILQVSCDLDTTLTNIELTLDMTFYDEDVMDEFLIQLEADAIAANMSVSVDDGSKKRATVSLSSSYMDTSSTSSNCDDGYGLYNGSCSKLSSVLLFEQWPLPFR